MALLLQRVHTGSSIIPQMHKFVGLGSTSFTDFRRKVSFLYRLSNFLCHADRRQYFSGHPVPSYWDLRLFYWLRPETHLIDQILNQYMVLLPTLTVLHKLTFLPNIVGFHRSSATDLACQQANLIPLNTFSRPIWRLAYTCIPSLRSVFPIFFCFLIKRRNNKI